MSYTEGTTILAADFNSFVTQTNVVWSVGSGDSGYGQTAIVTAGAGSVVNSTQWSELRDVINRAASHQGTALTGGFPSANLLEVGDVIDIHDFQTNITNITNNRFDTSGSDMVVSNIGTETRGTTWGVGNTTITVTVCLTWSSANNIRHFFNSGGTARLDFFQNTNVTPQDQTWVDIFANIGVVSMDYTQTTRSGSAGTGSALGYYDLTGSFLQIFTASVSEVAGGAYAVNDVFIEARTITNGIEIRVTFEDEHIGSEDEVSAGTGFNIDIRKANLTFLNDVAIQTPTFTGDGELVEELVWPQQQKIQASDGVSNELFGESVSISDDGNTVIVGASEVPGGVAGGGAAYIFTRSGGTWAEQQKLEASDLEIDDGFGFAVSISGDGLTAIVGAHFEDTNGSGAGAAYIFSRSGETWTEQQKIQSDDIEAADEFSWSVTLSNDGDTALVGAYGEDSNGAGGSVYVFTRSGVIWTQTQKLQASDKSPLDNFGRRATMSGDGTIAMIGAYHEGTGGFQAGAAYFFTRSGETWTEQQKITASDTEAEDEFGHRVSLSSDGDTVIIGASLEDTGAAEAGAAYIFTRSGNTWTEQQKLQASDKQADDRFGQSVSISSDGDTVIIGAYFEDTVASGAGAVYIFTRSGGTWTELKKVQANDAQADDNFGNSVAISGDSLTAIVGTRLEDTGGPDIGAAYLFTAT